ncbi:ABC transporter ATP-binding protein [Priestia endophytica]|jgi:iron complex transport system ATP-binding protein|uniref:Iron complex transport system ATP-binding protein n=1 Tax=Priestia endophytica DSM 13796 TaxID=1121089 RepID=A0A1I6C6B6_9BACI|nr:ABC transporter ATP-binding protein [Priestia endophytica]KYG30522.1 ABC transporter [Priestia endophytica]MBG9814291.1 ABC transporter [Priestia endophytica]RAS80198.1 ABC transporter [Priestia endophytica]RAS87014.1 ABC transporter [Priestia endophytica]SFQ88723.1 iron complex transport system ATP-binding protein [Priestia endophytica DSM 13796]
MISIEHVTTLIGNQLIIDDVSLSAEKKQFVGIIGPNGSGKSTLLKNIYRVLPLSSGKVMINGDDFLKMKPKEAAKQLAVVSQETPVTFDFSVKEMVLMGRAPYKRMFDFDHSKDDELALEMLKKVGMETFINRNFLTLSGGEKQRVIIARALIQQGEVLILDEPTNHLDIHHQLHIMDAVKDTNMTVIAALHDLNIASMYCDYLFVMREGKIFAQGRPEEVLNETLLREVFEVETIIHQHETLGKPHITFLPNRFVKRQG